MANQTSSVLELNSVYAGILLPNSIITIFITILGLVGNVVILFVYAVGLKDTAGERFFIPVLAVVDTFGCLTSVSYYLLDNYFLFVFPSDPWCRLLSFLMCFTSGFSGHTLLLIALQRYLLICRPLRRQMTTSIRRLSVLVLFVVTLVYSAPLFVTSGIRISTKVFLNQNLTARTCVLSVNGGDESMAYFLILLLIVIINISVIAGFYIPVTKTIYHHMKMRNRRRSTVYSVRMYISEATQSPDSTLTKSSSGESFQSTMSIPEAVSPTKVRINVMFLVIISVYIFSYIPSIAILLVTYVARDFDYLQLSSLGINGWIFSARLIYLNHVVNPFIYGYFDGKLKSELKRLFCRK